MAGMIVAKAPNAAAADAAETALGSGSVFGVAVSGYARQGLWFAIEFDDGDQINGILGGAIAAGFVVPTRTRQRPTAASIAAADDDDALLYYACGRIDGG